MYLPGHRHPGDLVGRWYIRLRYSFRLFNFWRHIMTLYTSAFELTTTSIGSQDRQGSQASVFWSWPYTWYIEQSVYFFGTSCRFNIWLAIATQQMVWYLELHDISHSSNQSVRHAWQSGHHNKLRAKAISLHTISSSSLGSFDRHFFSNLQHKAAGTHSGR